MHVPDADAAGGAGHLWKAGPHLRRSANLDRTRRAASRSERSGAATPTAPTHSTDRVGALRPDRRPHRGNQPLDRSRPTRLTSAPADTPQTGTDGVGARSATNRGPTPVGGHLNRSVPSAGCCADSTRSDKPAGHTAAITGFAWSGNTMSSAMTDTAAKIRTLAAHPGRVATEAARRRTFAVISHPDAGKSADRGIGPACAGDQRGRRHPRPRRAASPRCRTGWRWRRLPYLDHVDRGCGSLTATASSTSSTPPATPTLEVPYRVLTAVDAAVMLIDAAKTP